MDESYKSLVFDSSCTSLLVKLDSCRIKSLVAALGDAKEVFKLSCKSFDDDGHDSRNAMFSSGVMLPINNSLL